MLDEDSHIGELAAPYVLGALEPDEVEAVELHLIWCEECRTLVEEEREVVQLLPYLAEPVDVPVRARRALFARIESPPEEDADTPVPVRRFSGAFTRLGWVAAASAAVVALVFAWNSLQMQQQVDKKNTELAIADDRAQKLTEVVSQNSFTVKFQSTGVASGAEGGVIVDPTKNAAFLVVNGLPRPVSGHSYVVWLVRGNDHTNAGVLSVDDQGHSMLYITPTEALASYDNILVTEETVATAANPSGTRMMAAQVGN